MGYTASHTHFTKRMMPIKAKIHIPAMNGPRITHELMASSSVQLAMKSWIYQHTKANSNHAHHGMLASNLFTSSSFRKV
jgi:hypothetical protein